MMLFKDCIPACGRGCGTHTQTVLKWLWWQAENTIRNTMTASGVPNDRGRFVTRINIGPRFFSACSFAASEADVDEAGYSPCGSLAFEDLDGRY